MNKGHQIKLYPTKEQEILLSKSCGVARFSYNWALARWQELYKANEKIKRNQLRKELTDIKRDKFPWMLEVSKSCPQYAISNLETAFSRFFNKQNKYPKFKKKGVRDSFVAIENRQVFNQKDFRIHIPRVGKIKCSENLRFDGKVNNVVVRRIADMWFAVINIEVPESIPTLKRNKSGDNQAIVGVDFGIKSMMVLSDGTIYENPRALKSNLKKLKRFSRSLSRKQKGSSNRRKAQMKLARQHYKVAGVRSNAIHQATTSIVEKYGKVVIEDLNVAGMTKNRKLSQALSDVSFSEIRRQLSYKCLWAGKELVVANRFYASSKTCSCCDYKKQTLKLSERVYKCDNCGLEIDRDLNAAKNLANYSPTVGLTGSNACGGSEIMSQDKCLPVNQEIKIIYESGINKIKDHKK